MTSYTGGRIPPVQAIILLLSSRIFNCRSSHTPIYFCLWVLFRGSLNSCLIPPSLVINVMLSLLLIFNVARVDEAVIFCGIVPFCRISPSGEMLSSRTMACFLAFSFLTMYRRAQSERICWPKLSNMRVLFLIVSIQQCKHTSSGSREL